MNTAIRLSVLTMSILCGWAVAGPIPALARGLPASPSLWLSCENGSEYTIRPLAVSSEGDLVTAQLVRRRGGAVHVRLMPMGFGYRYAGLGVWFDGQRESVYLYLSKYHPIACTVRGPEQS